MARPNPTRDERTSELLTPGRRFTVKKGKHKSLSLLLRWGQILGLISGTCPSKPFTNARGSLQLMSDQPNSLLITITCCSNWAKNIVLHSLSYSKGLGGGGVPSLFHKLYRYVNRQRKYILAFGLELGSYFLPFAWEIGKMKSSCMLGRVLCPLKLENRVGVFMRHAKHPCKNSPPVSTQGNYLTQKQH